MNFHPSQQNNLIQYTIMEKTLATSLFQSIAPAVSSCDDRLSRLETSQNILMENLTLLEAKLFNLRETNGLAKSALPILKKRSQQLINIRNRMKKLHSTMDTMMARVKNTENKLLTLPKLPKEYQQEDVEENEEKH